MTVVAQIQNLRGFVTSHLCDVIDWQKHVRDDPVKQTTGDIAYIEIVTPFNRYKMAIGSAYAEPPHGAANECRSLGWVTFDDNARDKHVLAPKNDLTYQDIAKHIHVHELTDAIAEGRRHIAEAASPREAQAAHVKLREVAAKAEKWGIKVRLPEEPVVHVLEDGVTEGETVPSLSLAETQHMPPTGTLTYHPASRGPAPFVGASIIYYCADRIAGMEEVPGILIRVQADGRAALQLFADLNEIQFKDNIHRRGTDAGNGRVHTSNCWDFNPAWLAEQERIARLEADNKFNKELIEDHRIELERLNEMVKGAYGHIHGITAELDRRAADAAKPARRGRPPKSETAEVEGAEIASELDSPKEDAAA